MVGRSEDDEDLLGVAEALLAETRLLRAQWTEIIEALDDLDGAGAGEPSRAAPAEVGGPAEPVPVATAPLAVRASRARRRRAAQVGSGEPVAANDPAAPTAIRPASEHATSAGELTEAGRHSAASRSARLVAVDMAIAGASREAVGERLRSLEPSVDPSVTLDSVFGAEATSEERSPRSDAR